MNDSASEQTKNNTEQSSVVSTPIDPQTGAHNSRNLSPRVWILIIVVIMVATASGFILSPLMRNFSDSSVVLEEQNEPTIEAEQKATKAPIEPTKDVYLKEYSDDRLKGMRFKYDPGVWTIKEVDEEHKQWTELKSNHGTLTLEYKLPVGVGGGLSFFKSSERVRVEGNLSRVSFDGNKYTYGLETKESISLYEQDADEKQQMLDHCAQPDSDMFSLLGLSTENCADIQQGNVIGHVNFPLFNWSITLKRIAELNEFKNYNADYYDNSNFDLSVVIVEVIYTGTSPEEADVIAKQFVPITEQ